MGKLKYLTKNIALFSISNFVSKILVFLLVPFYTNVLTTYEYGVADIIQVTLLLLVPMITLNIGEAALRFGVEEVKNRVGIFNVGIKYVVRASLVVAFVCFALRGSISFIPVIDPSKAEEIKWYLLLFVFLFAANALYEFLVLYFQGSELVETVVLGSIACTAATIAFNLLFLLGIKIGLNGYIYSQILAYAIASVLMIAIGKKRVEEIVKGVNIEGEISESGVSGSLEDRMLEYSKPMIMYSTASWVNNAVDRYFVLYLCGAAVNGVYGVAYKIPAILMVFQRIFAQSWQMSATKAHKDEDSEEFFSNMYKVYNSFMVLGCGFLVLIVKLLAGFLFRKEFFEAWKFVPPLLISVIFGALTGFLGSICLAHKDSKSMGKATGIGALVNVILNLLFIPTYQAMGAAVATGISYFTMCMMALFFVRSHVKLKVSFIRNFISYIVLIIQSVITISEPRGYVVYSLVLFVTLVVIYFKDFLEISKVFLSKIKREK
ncbi:MAG: polysaccharide biosynthesis C-terminal domain-containing protein [Lachnospiraceae bacterium]|nr:polysaccharide biosynthesis C-terminal domain-containing protein [Lachnospiraceae bacterium]